jgi:hypothetical protein
MSTGAEAKNQFSIPGDGDKSGGNSSGGKSPMAPRLHQPAKFQGRSGMPDNQDTKRPVGSS